MEINILEYFSDNEIKDIITEEIKSAVRRKFSEDHDIETLLSDVSHSIIFDEVQKVIPNYKDIIAEGVHQHIKKKDFYYVMFRDKEWYHKEGLGLTYVNNAINSNIDIIKEKVKKCIDDFDVKPIITKYFENRLEEVADEFGRISDFLYELKSADN